MGQVGDYIWVPLAGVEDENHIPGVKTVMTATEEDSQRKIGKDKLLCRICKGKKLIRGLPCPGCNGYGYVRPKGYAVKVKDDK